MEKEITYEDISLIGMELFRKNNEKFMRSKLSPVMSRMFKAANKGKNIKDDENVYYMKSGIIHNKILYIYSDELLEKDPKKLYDIMYFNNSKCIWLYSNNIINMIDSDPFGTIDKLYTILLNIFSIDIDYYLSFIDTEKNIAKIVMKIRLIQFLRDTYGILNDKGNDYIIHHYFINYTKESANKFITHVLDNYYNENYFKYREYLDAFLLLKLRNNYFNMPSKDKQHSYGITVKESVPDSSTTDNYW